MFHQKITDVLSIEEQKRRMKSNQSILNQKQINHMMQLKNLHHRISAHPRFIKKTLQIPFNILFYGNKIYVLSDIQLGQGGCGIVWAAEEFSLFRKSHWVAIKEGLNKTDYFEMAKVLRDNKEEFWDQYEEILLTLYCIQFKKNYSSLSKKKLKEYAGDLLQKVSDSTYNLARIHAHVMSKVYNISIDIFTIGYFVYSVSPLINGIDLSQLIDPTIFLHIQKSIFESNNVENSRLQWDYFLLNYAKCIGDTISTINQLHRMGFLHRDIKPSNIMLNKYNHIKLIDFDTCVEMKNDTYRGTCEYLGTFQYQSPKFLDFSQKNYSLKNKKYTFTRAEDIFSLGVSLQELNAEKLFLCIFTLHPALKNSYSSLLNAILNLTHEDVYLRSYAMHYLVSYYPQLIQALNRVCEKTYQNDTLEMNQRKS